MEHSGGLLASLRQPEYTGENRCVPCTVVNVAIAFVGSVGLAAGLTAVSTAPTALAVTGVAFGLSLALIYLRGYLVPGTPTLTKRYFPDRLLGAFGKAPETAASGPTTTGGEHVQQVEPLDPETELVRAGALEECEDVDDLCLTPAFREAWHDEMAAVEDDDLDRDRLLELLDVDAGAVEYEEYGDAFKATLDGDPVGTWESRAAFVADLAGATSLADFHPDWASLGVGPRSQLLNGLRLFIDVCPACGDVPEFGTETMESCCSTYQVAAVECAGCGARLFESNPG